MEKLSVILPVHNERYIISNIIEQWISTLENLKLKYQLIIVEDGSTDGTFEILDKLKNKYSFVLEHQKKRRGYGEAIISGIKKANADDILCVDSDGQYDPKDIKIFWKMKSVAQVIKGWRGKRSDDTDRIFFSSVFRMLFNFLYPNGLHDPSAAFVLFNKNDFKEAIKLLSCCREGFWWGFSAYCLKNKISIREIRIRHLKRIGSKTNVYVRSQYLSIFIRNFYGLIKLKLFG